MVPAVEELKTVPSPADALRAFAGADGLILFDSALQRDRLGQFLFLAADPVATFEVERASIDNDPFASVRTAIARFNEQFQLGRVADLPPFQGGVAGVLSYELGGCWEAIPREGTDEFEMPDACFGIYDWVIAWDHRQNRAWVISHGLPGIGDLDSGDDQELNFQKLNFEVDRNECRDRAAACVRSVISKLNAPEDWQWGENQPQISDALPASEIAKQYALPGWDGVTSDFSREDYLTAVKRVIEYIHAGDIFQANLSQRLLARCNVSPTQLYLTLRECNQAPFAGFLAHDDWAIVSASPERFLRVENGAVETRPIKGTRQRRAAPEADLFTRDELRQSEKDIAENVMIVDLLRNDLSRVCEPGSISVPELCVVETYETVQHLVSEIRGTLKRAGSTGEEASDIWSLLAASFPGGSITGAPKVRAMEIISELEPTVRGPYCGSLFYSGFDGTFDSSILIRSFVCRRGWVQCRVGGGIVAQSDPVAEYEETLHKAKGMLRALHQSGLCEPLVK